MQSKGYALDAVNNNAGLCLYDKGAAKRSCNEGSERPPQSFLLQTIEMLSEDRMCFLMLLSSRERKEDNSGGAMIPHNAKL